MFKNVFSCENQKLDLKKVQKGVVHWFFEGKYNFISQKLANFRWVFQDLVPAY